MMKQRVAGQACGKMVGWTEVSERRPLRGLAREGRQAVQELVIPELGHESARESAPWQPRECGSWSCASSLVVAAKLIRASAGLEGARS